MNDLQDFNQLYKQKTDVAFCDVQKARQALTHDSIGPSGAEFERMEFLGDGCLEMVMAYLLVTHTDFPEGKMSQLRSRLTSKESLAQRIRTWNIEPWIVVGKAMDLQNLPDTIYADIFESLLGALFLDQGLGAVQKAVECIFLKDILEARDSGLNFASPKTQLQEWTMSRQDPLPLYRIVNRQGPPHAPIYEIEVAVGGQRFIAKAGSVKQAEFMAAQAALQELCSG